MFKVPLVMLARRVNPGSRENPVFGATQEPKGIKESAVSRAESAAGVSLEPRVEGVIMAWMGSRVRRAHPVPPVPQANGVTMAHQGWMDPKEKQASQVTKVRMDPKGHRGSKAYQVILANPVSKVSKVSKVSRVSRVSRVSEVTTEKLAKEASGEM